MIIEKIKKIRRVVIQKCKPLPKYFKIASLVERDRKVLDFGCWQGDLSKILIDKKNSKVIGCDLMEKCEFKDPKFRYFQVLSEKENFPLKENFDYVIFADVLEHLKNPKKMLKETFRHTNKIIISIPNNNFFLYKIFPKIRGTPRKTYTSLASLGFKIF